MSNDPYNIIKLGSKNRGYRYERIKFDERENAFAKHWQDENDRKKVHAFNHGLGILQDLLIDVPEIHHRPMLVTKITPRDRFIVATIIQWLGSGVGWCFLGECLKMCGYKIVRIEEK